MRSAVLSLFLLLFTTTVQAREPVSVDKLALEQSGSSATIHYQISAAGWKALGGAVSLELGVRDGKGNTQVEFVSDLAAVSGAVSFALPKGSDRELEIYLAKGSDVVPMTLGGTIFRRVTLQSQQNVQAVAAAPSQDWTKAPSVIKECNSIFSSSVNRSACLDSVAKSVQDPTAVIKQCGKDMESDSNEMACVKHLALLSFDALPAMAACAKAMEGDTKELECMSYVGMATSDPTEIVQSCDASSSGDTAELQCVKDVLSR